MSKARLPVVNADFTIAAEYASLAMLFASKEQTRFYLSGFYVEAHPKGGALIVATDGHAMAIFRDEAGKVTLPGNVALNAKMLFGCRFPRLLIAKRTTASLYETDGDGKRTDVFLSQDGAVVDAGYVDWRHALPAAETVRAVQVANFNPALLGRFAKVAGKDSAIRIVPTSEHGPAWVLTARTDFVGVIMPMRETMKAAPWLRTIGPPRRSKAKAA